jgi:hypothetical protein
VHVAGALEDLRAFGVDVLAETYAPFGELVEELGQEALAMLQRKWAEVLAVEIKEVEDEVDESVGSALGEVVLELVEI